MRTLNMLIKHHLIFKVLVSHGKISNMIRFLWVFRLCFSCVTTITERKKKTPQSPIARAWSNIHKFKQKYLPNISTNQYTWTMRALQFIYSHIFGPKIWPFVIWVHVIFGVKRGSWTISWCKQGTVHGTQQQQQQQRIKRRKK